MYISNKNSQPPQLSISSEKELAEPTYGFTLISSQLFYKNLLNLPQALENFVDF